MTTKTEKPRATSSGLTGSATMIIVATALAVTTSPAPLTGLAKDAPQRRPSETAIFTTAGHPDGRLSEIGRLGSAMFLRPDRFVFVDSRALHRLVFVDMETGEVVSAGREGDGPEEFRSTTLLSRSGGDAVFVWDSRRQRLSLVGAVDGKGVVSQPEYDKSPFEGGGPLSMAGFTSPPVAAYPDGALIIRERQVPSGGMFGMPNRDPGPFRDTVHYNVTVPGAEKRLLAERLASESFSLVSGRSRSSSPVIFGHRLLQRQVGQHLAVAQTDLGTVVVFDRAGAVVADIPLPPGKRASDDQIEAERGRIGTGIGGRFAAMMESMAERMPEGATVRQIDNPGDRLRDVPANEVAPAIDRMLGDLDGRLWLRLFDPADTGVDPADLSEQWQVWDLSGPRLLFTVTLADGEELLDAAGDRVLVGTQDEFEVDYVVVRELGAASEGR